jgi:DNA-binding NtrC family response regulator
MASILIIDDEKAIRNALKDVLVYEKYQVTEAKDGQEALDILQKFDFDIILCDIKMPHIDGIEVLQRAKAMEAKGEFIMITAHGNIDTAVEATKLGAYDFLQKPPDLNRLLITVRNALNVKNLKEETTQLKQKFADRNLIIGQSAAMNTLLSMVDKVAPTDARVLITGPNGAGKELIAKQIHKKSKRKNFPLIEVNCAAIPSELIESELFGHEKGAFTSAIKNKTGKFELAHQGTLFLDEIGDMSLSAQAKVLRVLQEKKLSKVGGEKEIEVDVRVIAATNKDLRKEIEKGNFREDLYHRIAVVLLQVPSLDERKEDIPLLVEHFLKTIAQEYNSKPKNIDDEAIALLQKKSWSGNIRELRNVVERLYIMSGDTILKSDVEQYAAK